MKKAVVFLFLCVAAAPAAAQTLSLEECRAAAVEHNRTLRNSRLDLDAASQTHREAFTNYFPQISASGGLFQAQHGLVQADFAVPQMGRCLFRWSSAASSAPSRPFSPCSPD